MVCFTPMRAYQGNAKGENGKRPLIFAGTKARGAVSLTQPLLYTLPCGGCLGCRMDRSTDWAIRCTHQASMDGRDRGGAGSVFLTLTIAPDKLLPSNSVNKKSMQRFWKRLRNETGAKFKYLDCGEYGDRSGRAHYHALLFGFDFTDKYYWRKSEQGHPVYRSPLLEKLWPFGHCEIGSVTFQSARYVASYVTKKMNGDGAEAHYTRVSPVDGQYYRVEPEFANMSLGIGKSWFDSFHGDCFPSDEIVLRDGKKRKVPRYYDKLFVEKFGEEAFKAIKLARAKRAAASGSADRSPQRLATREECETIRRSRLARSV